jgi:hypothetical protein
LLFAGLVIVKKLPAKDNAIGEFLFSGSNMIVDLFKKLAEHRLGLPFNIGENPFNGI